MNTLDLITKLKSEGFTKAQITQIVSNSTPNPSPIVNTTSSIQQSHTIDIKSILAKAKLAFSKEKLVPVSVAVPYGNYVGGYIRLGLNGVTIELPADGNTYKVPESFARALKQRLRNLDEIYSAKGPTITNSDTSEWAKEYGLQSGDKKVATHSMK